jgi:GNAT superfamily N-acetyltransferase
MSIVAPTAWRPDPSWTPRNTTVAMASSRREASLVYRLRYRVCVHEQGRRPDGADCEREEMQDPLDPRSCLWYARDGQDVVGTITQTLAGPDFDLSLLPAALELSALPSERPLFGFSSRFAIDPEFRGRWVLSSLARHTYAHGRTLGGKFDFMATIPALVALYERMGYVRYTGSIIDASGRDVVGLQIPMVLPATDFEHLRRVRSVCLSAAERFAGEPQWGRWLRAHYPMIDAYYGSEQCQEEQGAALAREAELPIEVAMELLAMSFAQRIPAGATLRLAGDRVTCSFLALAGTLVARRGADAESRPRSAPDGVEFSQVEIRSATDALVLCMPDWAVARLQRRHPGSVCRLKELLTQSATGGILR